MDMNGMGVGARKSVGESLGKQARARVQHTKEKGGRESRERDTHTLT